MANIFARSERH